MRSLINPFIFLKFSIGGVIFFLPISLGLSNFFIFLTFISIIYCQFIYKYKLNILINPLALVSLFIVAIYTISLSYTNAPEYEALKYLHRYLKLIFFPLFCFLSFNNYEKRFFLKLFILSTFITVVFSWTDFFNLTKISDPVYGNMKGDSVFRTHITQGFLFDICAFFSFFFFLFTKNISLKLLYFLISILTLSNIFVVMEGRTGKTIALFLFAGFIFTLIYKININIFIKFIISLLTVSVCSLFILNSNLLSIKDEIVQTKNKNIITSSGIRLELYKNSLKIIKSHPLIGGGIASIITDYKKLSDEGNTPIERVTSTNLHNEYLMQLSQFGIIDLALFVFLLLSIFKRSFNFNPLIKYSIQSLLFIFSIGCFFNSFLYEFTEGYTFIFLIGILIANDQFAKNPEPY